MTLKVILNKYILGDTSMASYLTDFVTESDKLQRTSNPSGSYQGAGIGEPHFLVNGAAYT
jgi:glucoamylase